MKNTKRELKGSFPYFSVYYTENGLVTYDKNLHIIHRKSMKELLGKEKYNTFIKFILDYIDTVKVPIQFHKRSAVINVSPVGNPITKEQRVIYKKIGTRTSYC